MNVTLGLRRLLQTNPDGIATIFRGRKRTWREIGERVSRAAAGLRSLGVATGDRVAVLALNSDRYLELYLAVAWAGAVIVPLNTRWSNLENEAALNDCRAKIIFLDEAFANTARTLGKTLTHLQLMYAGDGSTPADFQNYEDMISGSHPMPDSMRDGSELAGLFYTGGTTGRSKGVMLSHNNLMSNALHALAEGLFGSTTTYLHAAPMFHLANGTAMYGLLLSGGTNVFVESFTAQGVLGAIESERVTDVLLVPTMIQMLADHPTVSTFDLSSLKRVFYGGSPINEAVLMRASIMMPHVEFIQLYGMTELSPLATILELKNHTGGTKADTRRKGAGRAVIGCEVDIIDFDGKPVPRGTVGEIIVRGDNVMLGYWERPEESSRAIVDGWMHTGDGGYMDQDGFIYIVDRVKDMIISGGENVYSVEVENALAMHPAVSQCAVFGIPSEQWGEQVHAVVVLKAGFALTASDLIEFSKTLIAGYKCPRSIDIHNGPLPLSGAGKILKRELRKPYWEQKSRMVS